MMPNLLINASKGTILIVSTYRDNPTHKVVEKPRKFYVNNCPDPNLPLKIPGI